MKKIVLLRHGESAWNKENRFTGWTDVDLTEKGIEEAYKAGELLRKEGYVFDTCRQNIKLRTRPHGPGLDSGREKLAFE